MCLFSFIIPVYNAAATLGRCLDSILERSTSDYEILLINDSSTDNSLEICECYANKYSQVNKSTSFTVTGGNNDEYCKINDMSGNACEWTTETSTYDNSDSYGPCVSRGGYCDTCSSQASYCTSSRVVHFPSHSVNDIAFRPLLYV